MGNATYAGDLLLGKRSAGARLAAHHTLHERELPGGDPRHRAGLDGARSNA
ncbi:MAG: hypothetical protein RL385_4225, partial [Pseudomonadota bacterium]